MNRRRLGLITSISLSLFAVATASATTFAWFQINYQNTASYNSAQITTTDSNLEISVATYTNDTIGSASQGPDGINYWSFEFNSHLDDLSFNGAKQMPFYKMTWADGAVGTTATNKTSCSITSGSTNGFYIFKLTFTNRSTTNDLYVYLGSNSSLEAADNSSASSYASECERVAFRTTDSQGINLSYWIPNRNSGGEMIGASSWTDASAAYSLANCYIGAPEETDSPVNSNMPTGWSSDVTNIVHYGDFSTLTESSENCDDGQFICEIEHAGGSPTTYNIYVLMWAEGTDSSCTSDALSGATTLTLEFIALSHQLWPED